MVIVVVIGQLLSRSLGIKSVIDMKKIVIILGALVSLNVFAGTGSGQVTGVTPYTKASGEKLFFIKVESKENSPSCNTTNRFVISDSNSSFNTTVSALLAAYHAKTSVTVKGGDSCSYWSNSEDISYVCFGDIAC